MKRRNFIHHAAAALPLSILACNTKPAEIQTDEPPKGLKVRHNPIGVSTYSTWITRELAKS